MTAEEPQPQPAPLSTSEPEQIVAPDAEAGALPAAEGEAPPEESAAGEAPPAEPVVEEAEEDLVINFHLTVSFLLGGSAFLVIFLYSFISGNHVLVAMLWGVVAFIAIVFLGYAMEALLNLPAISSQQEALVEVTENGDEDGDALLAGTEESQLPALGTEVDVTVADEMQEADAQPDRAAQE